MGLAVKATLVIAFAVVQTVAPWLCCCGGARVVAAVSVEPAQSPTPKAKCCTAKTEVAPKPAPCPEHPSRPSPAPAHPGTPCDRCTTVTPVVSALPEPVVVPETGQVSQLIPVDLSAFAVATIVAAGATAADPPPERQSPSHVRIRVHHAMRC